MNYEVYHIPTNFTDAGRIMGLFELRNLVEAVVLTIPVLYLCIAFLPFALSTKIMVTLVTVVPVGGFGRGFDLVLGVPRIGERYKPRESAPCATLSERSKPRA